MLEKQELIEIAERCWQACCEADIGAHPMMTDLKDQWGRSVYEGVRFQTYQQMLNTMLWKEASKESWQE